MHLLKQSLPPWLCTAAADLVCTVVCVLDALHWARLATGFESLCPVTLPRRLSYTARSGSSFCAGMSAEARGSHKGTGDGTATTGSCTGMCVPQPVD